MDRSQLNSQAIEELDVDGTVVYSLFSSNGSPLRFIGYTDEVEVTLTKFIALYSHFNIEEYDSEEEAFVRASTLFHHLVVQLDEERHPPSPDEKTECPVCKEVIKKNPIEIFIHQQKNSNASPVN